MTFEPNSTSSEKLRVGLKVLANVLKAAINADLSANTGALRWQGAMTHRLEVGVGFGKKIRTDGWRGPHLSNGQVFVLVRAIIRHTFLSHVTIDEHRGVKGHGVH